MFFVIVKLDLVRLMNLRFAARVACRKASIHAETHRSLLHDPV
jgi:hypothetical protein